MNYSRKEIKKFGKKISEFWNAKLIDFEVFKEERYVKFILKNEEEFEVNIAFDEFEDWID